MKPTQKNVYLSDHITGDIVDGETSISYFKNPLAPAQKKLFIQGKMPIEIRLDLHGLTAEQAQEKIVKALQYAEDQELRHMLLIHGKGGAQSREPILKNRVNSWLRQLPQILAFHSAQPRHGGTGALYVLLTRK